MKVRTVHRIAPAENVTCEGGYGPFKRADNPRRGLHPDIDLWLAERIVAGMRPQAIVVASGGTVSIRTAYRWRKTLRGLQVVEFDGWRATFALRHGLPPTRMTSWEPVPARELAAS